MVDIHTHILPGVDDGAQTIEDSIQMIQQATDAGVDILCATPHILDGVNPLFQEKINRAFQLLCSHIDERRLKVQLVLGSEIYIRPCMESLKRFNFFSLNQTGKYILMELPLGRFPSGTEKLMHGLQLEGVTPIIAHPERSINHKEQLPEIQNLIRWGALIQINAGSVLGHFGKLAREWAECLLEQNLAHFVASDAHNPLSCSPAVLSQAFQEVAHLVGERKTEELVEYNPSLVLKGESLFRNEKELNAKEQPALLLKLAEQSDIYR